MPVMEMMQWNSNALTWYFTNLIIIPCYAREIHTFDNEIQTQRRSFLCPYAKLSIFKFLNRRLVQFELCALRVTSADFCYGSEVLKGYSKFYFNIEQDLHFTWTSFLKLWDWKLAWEAKMATFLQMVWFKHWWALYGSHHWGQFRLTVLH